MNWVLDPGHGGDVRIGRSTPHGIVTRSGLREKDLTLAVARDVAARLGGGATLTREGDINLSLAERCAASRRQRAAGFLSIHASEGAGNEVYVHPLAGRESWDLAHGLAGDVGAEVRSQPLAVLHPDHHAHGAAAAMIELAPASAARLAGVIASRLARYGNRCQQQAGAIPMTFGVSLFKQMDTVAFVVPPPSPGGSAGISYAYTAVATSRTDPGQPPEALPAMFIFLVITCTPPPPPFPTPPVVTVGHHGVVHSSVDFADGRNVTGSMLLPGPGVYFIRFLKPYRGQEIAISGNVTP